MTESNPRISLDVKTTLTVYAHLINTEDHTSNMAALSAVAAQAPKGDNVTAALPDCVSRL